MVGKLEKTLVSLHIATQSDDRAHNTGGNRAWLSYWKERNAEKETQHRVPLSGWRSSEYVQ